MKFDDVLQQAKNAYQHSSPGKACPSDNILAAYIHQELSRESFQVLDEHLKRCEACRLRMLKMEVSRQKSDYFLEQGFRAALDDLRQTGLIPPETESPSAGVAQYFWELEESGQALTGQTSSVTREHYFTTQKGYLKITCAWGDALDDEPAFLWLGWEPGFAPEQAFSLQLVDLESRKVFFTLPPKITGTEEQRTFKEDELRFNPVRERWGIQLTIL